MGQVCLSSKPLGLIKVVMLAFNTVFFALEASSFVGELLAVDHQRFFTFSYAWQHSI